MKKYFYLLCALALFVLAILSFVRSDKIFTSFKGNELKEEGISKQKKTVLPGFSLKQCRDNELGIGFLCEFGWQQRKVDHALIITIHTDPDVKMKVLMIPIDIKYIQQLSHERLSALGKYKEGFVIEETQVAGLNAIKIKAFAKEDPNIRLSDYYFVRNESLYSVLFSINPKDAWDEYKFLFQEIIDSLAFK